MAAFLNREKGTWVLLSFVGFFGLVVVVNAVFITVALRTHSGVITEQPYEKGLAYDAILEEAQAQPDIQGQASFEEGVLRWVVRDENGRPLEAQVSARLVRPVKGGHDFEVALTQVGEGVYEAKLDLPMQGRWDALLKAKWHIQQQAQHYQTRFSLTAK